MAMRSRATAKGQLDAQRSETRALGTELHEKMESLMARQDAVEALVRGNNSREVFAVPGRQRTAIETPSRQEGKKSTPNNRREGNGSTAPETRAP